MDATFFRTRVRLPPPGPPAKRSSVPGPREETQIIVAVFQRTPPEKAFGLIADHKKRPKTKHKITPARASRVPTFCFVIVVLSFLSLFLLRINHRAEGLFWGEAASPGELFFAFLGCSLYFSMRFFYLSGLNTIEFSLSFSCLKF